MYDEKKVLIISNFLFVSYKFFLVILKNQIKLFNLLIILTEKISSLIHLRMLI